MKKQLSNFIKDENGASLAEYGILVALIAVVSILVIGTFGGKIKSTFEAINNEIK